MTQRAIGQLPAAGWRLSEAIGLGDGTVPLSTEPAQPSRATATPGDREVAFDKLVADFQQPVTRLARRLLGWRDADLDDIVGDVFLSALEHWSGYRGEASAWTWLAAITINRCRSHQRRKVLKQRWWGWVSRNAPLPSTKQSSEIEQDETARQVRDAVAELVAKDREVIVLFYLEEMSAKQISEIVGVSTAAIDVRLHRARAKLRVTLGGLVES